MDKDIIVKTLPEALQKKNTLLKGLFSGEISMKEFDKECAYWFISCEDFEPKLLPTRPKELLEYDSFTVTEKKNTSDKFWRQGSIYNYLEQKKTILDRNKGMLDKLIEFKSYIPDGDITTLAKFDRYIMLYKQEKEYQENWQDRGLKLSIRKC